MANSLTPQDVYALVNEIVREATGSDDIDVVDTSSFVSVGEMLLRTSAENTLNAISCVVAKTIFSVRPYKAKFNILRRDAERWGGIVRKVVNLYSEAEAAKDWNTNLNANNLADGQSVDHYEILAPKVMQLNFYGTKLITKHITRFRDQLALAFHSEAEFTQFINSIMTEFFNEIELILEEESRLTIINMMAGVSSMGLTEVDLVQEFNEAYGTTYTRAQLLSTYLESFMKFVSAQIKIYSDSLTDMSTKYHANITGKAKIMRHTPKSKQKMLMYGPFFTNAKAAVYSSLFNPSYLEIGEMETVNYWQSANDPTAIQCKPNILDVATGNSKTAETDVELDYVLGALFDEEALGIIPQFDYAASSPLNARGGYYNLFYHFRANYYNDYTENFVLFVLGEGGE